MASPIRLITLDMDGTLIYEHKISAANLAAMQACRAAGVQVAIASGRIRTAILPYTQPAGLVDLPMIAANGAAVWGADGSLLHRKLLDPATAVGILTDWLALSGGYWVARMPDSLYLLPDQQTAAALAEHYRPAWAPGWQLEDALCSPRQAIDSGCQTLCKIVICHKPDSQPLAALAARAGNYPLAHFTSSWCDNIEVMPAGVHKGYGVRMLCRHLGIDPADVLAMGDNENDREMLAAVGHPVLMGNAADSMRADFTTLAPTCQQDGVAWALRRFVLGEI